MLYLTLLLLAPPAMAVSSAQLVAEEDAVQTFAALDSTVIEYTARDWDSLVRFKEKRRQAEAKLKRYCESMKPFPKIEASCEQKLRGAQAAFSAKEAELIGLKREDKYGAYRERINTFDERTSDLRAVQDNGDETPLAIMKQKSEKLIEDLNAFCPAQKDMPDATECLEVIERMKARASSYVASRERVYPPAPLAKKPRKVYRDTAPIIRCSPQFPDAGQDLTYEISDPLGGYRYSGMRKSRFGYVFEIPLASFESKSVNDSFHLYKSFSRPGSKRRYEVNLGPQHFCPANGSGVKGCKVSALGIHLTAIDNNETEIAASSSHNLKLDASFSASIETGDSAKESFGLNCMVVSRVRLGGWALSDDMFED